VVEGAAELEKAGKAAADAANNAAPPAAVAKNGKPAPAFKVCLLQQIYDDGEVDCVLLPLA
jgi:hypothetical protein